MTLTLKYVLLALSIIFFFIILILIKKGSFSLKYSLVWLGSSLFLILCVLFPNVVENLAKIIGFEVESNMIFIITIGICFLLLISLTIIVTSQSKKILILTEELSILKKKVDEIK
jgi:Uncharacterized conserved protein (DUF2304).